MNCNGTNGDCNANDFVMSSSFTGGSSNTNLPQDEYCVYKGVGDNTTITNLINGNNYYFKIYTYLNPWSDNLLSPILNVSALPVDILSFKVRFIDEVIRLKWQTGYEVNNDYFEIQKSKDGIRFNAIGRINGSGNSYRVNDYLYDDADSYPYKSYYRLKQTDFDGSYTYSKVICIRPKVNEFTIEDYLDYMQINSSLLENVKYIIINNQGKEINRGIFNKSFQIIKRNYLSGIYYVQLKTPYHEEVLKLGLQ
jgi:hypothetical protein